LLMDKYLFILLLIHIILVFLSIHKGELLFLSWSGLSIALCISQTIPLTVCFYTMGEMQLV
jgi:hypothetical protein